MDYNILKEKPWNNDASIISELIYQPKGMIGPEERRCYFWLGKNCVTDDRCIVDAGAFLGASALCFAAGAAAAGKTGCNGRKLIHAYDYFKVVDQYVGEAIRRDFRPIAKGDSYLDIFQQQTAAFEQLIEPHPGDFLAQNWHGDPIALLFIDIAKTSSLNAHVIGEFFPSLIPGESILVHQDYFHCWHPYIHISMEFFDDEFELMDEHVPHQSRVWRLVKPLSEEKLARMRHYDLSKAERLKFLDRLVEKSSGFMAPMVKVVRIWQHCLDGDWDTAAAGIAELRRDFRLEDVPGLWAKQALEVERHIAHATSGGREG